MTLDPIFVTTAQYAIGLLFITAGAAKVSNFKVFQATLADYELLPASLLPVAAVLICVTELAAGIAAFIHSLAAYALAVSLVLLLTYAAAIGINLLRGRRDIDCGCTGPAVQQLLSHWLLLRNVVLAGVAVVGLLPTANRLLHVADFALIALCVAGGASLYAAVNQLMANAPRLDALDSFMETADG